MESDIAHNLRVEKWRQIVLEANNSDIPKIQYIREHKLTENSFYYWQRYFRREEAANGTLPVLQNPETGICSSEAPVKPVSSFIEVTAPSTTCPSEEANDKPFPPAEPAWKVMLRHGDYSIYIDNGVTQACLETVMQAISHA